MKDRALIEEAAISLRSGLELHPGANEQKFQDWFEKYDRIFSILGFKDWIAHPELVNENGEKLVPDFMVSRPNGAWEIFELKTPDTAIIIDKEKRSKFYSSLESYVSQALEYAEYFDESANRERFKERYGVEVQKSLRSTIVAGRNDGLDKAKVHKMRMQRGGNVDILTFDDVLEQLEFARSVSYSEGEGVPGVSVHLLASIGSSSHPLQYLFDFGGQNDRNRISAYVKDEAMCFRVIDANAQAHIVRLKQGIDGFSVRDMNYYALEMACVEDSIYLTIGAGGKLYAESRIQGATFDFDGIFNPGTSHLHYTLGSDMFAKNNAALRMNGRFLTYRKTLTFTQKYENLLYFLLGNHELFLNFFGEGTYAVSKQHPILVNRSYPFFTDNTRIPT